MDFDAIQRERQQQIASEFGDHPFTLRGETFYVRRVIPYAAIREVSSIDADSSDKAAFAAIETAVLAMLAGGGAERERFQKVISDSLGEFPVTYVDLLEVHNWMIREATSLPPTQPSSSSDTSVTNGNPLTETSSDEQAEASKT
jgi:hypothetical protein